VPIPNRLFVRLTVSAVEVNVSVRFRVTQLQVTACVFGSRYAFHLIAACLTVCPFFGSLFCTTYRFAVTRL